MTSPHFYQVSTRQLMDNVVTVVASYTPYKLPLYEAARDGLINLIQADRGAVIPRHALKNPQRPIIVLIGDDDYMATGPSGWSCAQRLANWGRSAMLHAAGGEAEHYEAAVKRALLVKRLVLIETDSAHEDEWAKLFALRMPTLCIRAPEDLPHPKLPTAEEMN